MLARMPKVILLAILAACGVRSSAAATPETPASEPDGPDDVEPPEGDEPPEDQYFCCQSVKFDGKEKTGHGDGCNMIDAGRAALCSELLYCPSGFVSSQGSVDCPL
jgi:hypothetical protein